MTGHWLPEEVELAVTDYLEMLRLELSDEGFNKAERNRRLQEAMPGRNRGSIEFKHQNISAILIELGYPYVQGYKPRVNYQELLREAVVAHLAARSDLSSLVRRVVDEVFDGPPRVDELLGILVDPPQPEKPEHTREPRRPMGQIPCQPNYLEIEARNRSLGLAGEELVMRFEHRRLWAANKKSLAERIEHVSRTQGDGLGYDIESFEESGKPRLIEVKSTRFGALTPFFLSKNEVQVSGEQRDKFFLYRVFNFRSNPRIFTLPGSLDSSCLLDPVQYRASVR